MIECSSDTKVILSDEKMSISLSLYLVLFALFALVSLVYLVSETYYEAQAGLQLKISPPHLSSFDMIGLCHNPKLISSLFLKKTSNFNAFEKCFIIPNIFTVLLMYEYMWAGEMVQWLKV